MTILEASELPRVLLANEQRIMAALGRHDVGVLRELMAPDLVFLTMHGRCLTAVEINSAGGPAGLRPCDGAGTGSPDLARQPAPRRPFQVNLATWGCSRRPAHSGT